MNQLKEKEDVVIEEQIDNKKEKLETFYNLVFIFFIASIIGWIYEMIFYKITENTLANRGFLYGPYVPVYGIGAVLIVVLLKKFKNHPVLLFLGMMLATGILEYVIGAFMFSVWHRRWWDYTGLFLNINGHVCLRSVISFAIGGIALVYFIEPYIKNKTVHIKERTKVILTIAIAVTMITDLILCLTIRCPIF